jgi:hypothetical protein
MYPNWRGLCGILTLTASLSILGCGNSPSANVRAVNASPGFAPFTFQVAQIGIAAALPYGTEGVQPKGTYSTIDSSGAYRIVGTGTNQVISTYVVPGTALASTKATLVANASYTIVSIGSSPGMGLSVLADTGTAPSSGQANVRFMSTSNSAGPVDLYLTAVGGTVGGNPVESNIGFNQPQAYTGVPAGTLELQITYTGSTQVLATVPFTPAAGSLYSVFFLDPAPGGAYKILVVNDPIPTPAKS